METTQTNSLKHYVDEEWPRCKGQPTMNNGVHRLSNKWSVRNNQSFAKSSRQKQGSGSPIFEWSNPSSPRNWKCNSYSSLSQDGFKHRLRTNNCKKHWSSYSRRKRSSRSGEHKMAR